LPGGVKAIPFLAISVLTRLGGSLHNGLRAIPTSAAGIPLETLLASAPHGWALEGVHYCASLCHTHMAEDVEIKGIRSLIM